MRRDCGGSTPTFVALALVLASCALVSCGDDAKSTTANDDVTSGYDVVEMGDTVYIETSCPSDDASGDSDADGLLNGLEDVDRDCVVDVGETDPIKADTDGDGLEDGDEDINRNGKVDFGESDPRLLDTDGDGVLDAQESSALVCLPGLLDLVSRKLVAETNLALPQGFTVQSYGDFNASAFSDWELGVFGFLALTDGDNPDLTAVWEARLQSYSSSGFNTQTLSSHEFFSWSLQEGSQPLSPRPAIRSSFRYTFGAGSANPDAEGISADQLRDHLLMALTGLELEDVVEAPPCPELMVSDLLLRREDGKSVALIAVLCAQTLEEHPETQFLLDDLANATAVAPAAFLTAGTLCEELDPVTARPLLEVLWVVDNSASMHAEQEALAVAMGPFVARLSAAAVQWRAAVTTTEAYLLASEPSLLAHDSLMDSCSGLRGDGFVSGEQADAVQKLQDWIANDVGCDPAIVGISEPAGGNTCGSNTESGLLSGAAVLASSAKGGCGEARQSDPAAKHLVIWVSDEEDAALKLDESFAPIDPTDARRAPILQEFTRSYETFGATGCALVGDLGSGSGGMCGPLGGNITDTEGAQAGQGYVDVTRGTGGIFGSICAERYDETLDECLSIVLGTMVSSPLSRVPVSSSIRVAVDSRVLERSRLDGWDYDADHNAILLFGQSLGDTSTVAVSYVTWVPPFD